MTKKIYFEPAGRIHSSQWELIDYPPEGYEFITDEPSKRGAIVTSDFFFFKSRRFWERLLPLNLTKARIEGFAKKIPQDTDLIYAYNHVVFRERPWVTFVEWVHVLIGRDIRHFRRYKRVIENALASSYCKGIITWCEPARESILLNLDCDGFEHKIEVVPLAVRPKNFVKNCNGKKVKLLFVGSADLPDGGFEAKGGKEVFKAFALLNEKYDNLELVVRSAIPQHIKNKYHGITNIKLIESVISCEQLEQEFKSADFFIQPTHDTPFGAFLQAMSYELPVITREAFLNSELVEDGVTGFVVKSSEKVPDFSENLIHTGATPQRHLLAKAMQTVDLKVVEGLVEKTSLLIESPELRRKMGKAGRWEVEEGKFSIKKRNEKLKRIFDEALGGA